MCNQFTTFHINSGLIPGGQILSNRQTVFFTSADPMNKEHEDPDEIDLNAPRLYWVDINLALKKGLKFYQTRSNAIILHETLPAYCIPKVVRMEIGEVMYEKVYASPRPPPKISLKHDWMKELGSEVARQPEGEVARQAKSSQPTQSNPNPNHDRTVRPVVCSERAPRSQEIETLSSREEDVNHDRTGRPAVRSQRASQTRCSRDSTNFNLEEETNHDRRGDPLFAHNHSVQC